MRKRLIVVTGVSRGLGRAMTAGFVQRGHSVAGCCRSADAVADLRQTYAGPNRFDVVDVADDDAVGRWAESLFAQWGVPDLLINNAALINAKAPLWRVPPDEFSRLIDVNVKGMYHTIRHFVPAMIERGSGVVVNFSSSWGRSIAPDVAPYCASKWAVEGLTRALAEELPPRLAAVSLNPGIIHTKMLESCFGDGAHVYPNPESWATRAVPLILDIPAEENGRALTVPGS